MDDPVPKNETAGNQETCKLKSSPGNLVKALSQNDTFLKNVSSMGVEYVPIMSGRHQTQNRKSRKERAMERVNAFSSVAPKGTALCSQLPFSFEGN